MIALPENFFNEFEQDLILACKTWYGEQGLEKVIANHGGIKVEHVSLENKYYWLKKVIIKLVNAGYYSIENIFTQFFEDYFGMYCFDSPINSKEGIIARITDRMRAMIQNMEVKDKGVTLVYIHDMNKKFVEKKEWKKLLAIQKQNKKEI